MTNIDRRNVLKTVTAAGVAGLAASNAATAAAAEDEAKPWRSYNLTTISEGIFVEMGIEFKRESIASLNVIGETYACGSVGYILDAQNKDLIFPDFPTSHERMLTDSGGLVKYNGYHELPVKITKKDTNHLPVSTNHQFDPEYIIDTDKSVRIPGIQITLTKESDSIELRYGGTKEEVAAETSSTIVPKSFSSGKNLKPVVSVRNNGKMTFKRSEVSK